MNVRKLFLIMLVTAALSVSLVLPYASAAGCTYCGDIIKTIDVGQVELGSSNTIKITAYDPHGLKRISISCTKLEPPVADAGPDQQVEMTGTSALVTFSGIGSVDPDGYIADYRWDFDDGYYGYGISTSHSYYEEGYYTITLDVTDNDGLTDSDTMELKVIEKPIITDDYVYDGIWVDSDQTITLTATDSSGIRIVKYCVGTGCSAENGQTVSGPPYTISFSQDMDELVRYRAWDVYDNPSDVGEIDVKIDKTNPTTTDNHDGEIHGNGYTVTLNCDDGPGSGCKETRYCISENGTSTCTPSSTGNSVVITCPSFDYCEKFINYYSVDNVDNQEQMRTSGKIKINTMISTCELTALDEYTTSADISLGWSGKDSVGGDDITGYMIWYRDNSGSWAVWNEFPATTASGTFPGGDSHTYDFRCQSQDEFGWGSYSTPVTTYVDTTPPTADFVSIPEWTGEDPFSLSWSGSDSGSGLKDYDVEYGTDGQDWYAWLTDTTLTEGDFGNGDPVSLDDGDTYYFRMRATDNAGLDSEWTGSQTVGIDFTLPTCSMDDLADYITTSYFTLSWSGLDTGSGINSYDVDYSDDGQNWIVFQNQTSDTSKSASLMDGEYHFRCRARDNAENVGDWSASEVAKVDTRAPGADADYESPVLVGENITVNASLYDVSEITGVVLVYGDQEITEHEKTEAQANEWNVVWTFPVTDEYGSDEFFVVTEDMHGNSKSHRFSFTAVLCEDGETQECGTDVGECEKGTRTCVSGLWGDCLGDLEERLEVCDGRDNDCDGEIDDGIDCDCVPGATQECGIDTGECTKGRQTCTEDREWGPCEDGYVGPSVEVCDGKDNDCNGEVDNGAGCCQEGTQRPCGFSNLGICKLGISACMNGVWGDCKRAVMPEENEICGNELDDDCDGDIDEGCSLCSNGMQDGEEDGVDCGGSCPPCGEFPWFILSIVGVVILVAVLLLWWFMKSKGEELTWDTLSGKWSG